MIATMETRCLRHTDDDFGCVEDGSESEWYRFIYEACVAPRLAIWRMFTNVGADDSTLSDTRWTVER